MGFYLFDLPNPSSTMLTRVQQRILLTLAKYGPLHLKALIEKARLSYDAKWQIKRLEDMGLVRVEWDEEPPLRLMVSLTESGWEIGKCLIHIDSILNGKGLKRMMLRM